MPTAEIPDGSLRYEITGRSLDGSSVPLAMLLPQSKGPVGLQQLIAGLAQHRTVITYDQRGTGGSSAAPASRSMASQASDFVSLLDALEIERTSLLCHSTGCGIGLSVAANYPDRINALVLAAPWTHADHHLTTMQNLRIAAARALEPKQYAHFNAALLFPPEYRLAHQAGFERIAAGAIATPQDADEIASRLDAILAFDARPLLPAIQTKTLAVAAKDDQLMPAWFAAEASRAMPNTELIELDGGGHMLLETRTAALLDIVLEFLERNVIS